MLRIIQNSTSDGAKSYYSTSDYYSEGQELVGQWRGKGAARLGLSGTVQRNEWDALCDNRDPNTGKTLTARQKSNRRIGYDVNFHVPKSVSLLYGLTRDDRILEAFRESVDATMQDMEAEMQTRVRKGGRDEDRTTGNMVWGEFIHFTARPVDGVPDPHLHAHCFTFNTTWDSEESRWKAGQFAGLKRDAPYFEAVFHSRLARKLEEIGLPVQRTRTGWELSGISRSTLRKFSRRTELIEDKAKARGVTDPIAKGALGAQTRERKRKNLTLDELRDEWRSRLTDDERDAVDSVASHVGDAHSREDDRATAQAVTLAIDHCFERNAVLPERELLTQALKRSYGLASPTTVTKELEARHLLTAKRGDQRLVTTEDVLAEERRMLDFARSGRGTCPALAAQPHGFAREWLNAGQRQAVLHVLHSHDRVILVRGAAGVGKTSMLQETAEAIERTGKRVFAFAPSAEASRGVLRTEGFADADTVARLLLDERVQERARGQVIVVDEAGQIGTRTMTRLFGVAERLGARVVLLGDRRQHGPIERGSALRLLEEEAGLLPAEIKEIQRQKGDYKHAVELLSEGRTEAGFRQLDKLGWIREVPTEDRYQLLAHEYVTTIAEGKTALVVSPTHREGERITHEIRAQLKQAGTIKGDERTFSTLVNANLTEADRRDPASYLRGDILSFHQNGKGFTKGERIVAGDGRLPLDQADRFQVFHRETLAIAPGELIRITQGGMTSDREHRLNNGAVYRVKGFNRTGNIVLANGWTVAKDFGHLTRGYVTTSWSSQGKTVDRVIIGQSADSLPASSREQLYVSVSRGRERATIVTDDKQGLLEAVSRSEARLSATELLADQKRHERGAVLQRMATDASAPTIDQTRERERMAYVR
jgi:conjugative relaxase-like TrwC/TraI family protein